MAKAKKTFRFYETTSKDLTLNEKTIISFDGNKGGLKKNLIPSRAVIERYARHVVNPTLDLELFPSLSLEVNGTKVRSKLITFLLFLKFIETEDTELVFNWVKNKREFINSYDSRVSIRGIRGIRGGFQTVGLCFLFTEKRKFIQNKDVRNWLIPLVDEYMEELNKKKLQAKVPPKKEIKKEILQLKELIPFDLIAVSGLVFKFEGEQFEAKLKEPKQIKQVSGQTKLAVEGSDSLDEKLELIKTRKVIESKNHKIEVFQSEIEYQSRLINEKQLIIEQLKSEIKQLESKLN